VELVSSWFPPPPLEFSWDEVSGGSASGSFSPKVRFLLSFSPPPFVVAR